MPDEPRTIPELLARQSTSDPNATAIICADGRRVPYGELHDVVGALATTLGAIVPTTDRKPPRIGAAMPNGADFCVLQLAAMSVGTLVPFNPRATEAEFDGAFRTCRVDCLVIPAGQESLAAEVADMLDIPIFRLNASWGIAGARPSHGPEVSPNPDDIAAVLMTSGSTGVPKLVPLSHRNLCASAYAVARSVELSPDDLCLVMWEQFHIGGLTDLLLAPLCSGGSLLTGGSFDADRFFELYETYRPTWFQTVPTTLQELLAATRKPGTIASNPRLRFVRSVAAATPEPLVKAAQDAFGVPVVRTLGMTEASPLITSTALPPTPSKAGSVGRSQGTEIRVLSDEGVPLPMGAAGLIAIRGENVFRGYEGDPPANDAVFRDGWFLTGDLGFLDEDGDLFLTGRRKELINRGGEKISPSEVDEAFAAHPDVLLVASFAVEHVRLGEDIACAFTATRLIDPAELREFLTGRLSAFKVPGQIFQLESLPLNPVGKIDRHAVAERVRALRQEPTSLATPMTPNEIAVARVWSAELSIGEISVDQDFAALDGDSLSALRIVVALEEHYRRPLPEDIFARFTTVRQFAECLDKAGFKPPDASVYSALSGRISEIHQERSIFSGDPEELLSAIAEADTASKLGVVLDHAVVHATPAEVRKLAQIASSALTSQRAGFFQGLALRRELNRWKREILRGPIAIHETWVRESVSDYAIRYSAPDHRTGEKLLVAGFSGNRMRLLMPTYRVLAGLDPRRIDLLLLMDPDKKLYLNGIPGIDGGLPGLADFVARFATKHGYIGVVGLGTSGGSAAVIEAGILAGFRRIVAMAPLTISSHEGLRERLEAVRDALDGPRPPVHVVHGQKDQNFAAAQEIYRLFPHSVIERYPYARKGILPAAEGRGELEECLSRWLAP